MAAYRLSIKASAVKELDAISPKRDRVRIVSRIQTLASDPRPPGCEKLAGRARLFRIRQGHYRVIYAIDDAERNVDIVKIGHRREVYRDSTG
ncbi:MAG: type II toxin-antitoxin system RelE/ParE family toxin [Casimicrobiaceae bacterium]